MISQHYKTHSARQGLGESDFGALQNVCVAHLARQGQSENDFGALQNVEEYCKPPILASAGCAKLKQFIYLLLPQIDQPSYTEMTLLVLMLVQKNAMHR